MNREIKFRAWNETIGVMVPWEDLILEKSDGDNFYLIGHKESKAWIRYDHKQHLMQYTGLKDMNGVEIYEGDIYKYKYYFNSESYEYRYSVVEWYSSFIAYEGVFHGYEFNKNYIEVVGNIYENPELLKEGN